MRFDLVVAGRKRLKDVSSTTICKGIKERCGFNRKQQKDIIRRCMTSGHVRVFTKQSQEVHINAIRTKDGDKSEATTVEHALEEVTV